MPFGERIVVSFFAFFGIASALLFFTPSFAGDTAYVKPTINDKCPICGMFVAKFPDWTAEVLYRDGTYRVFDGAKDMFKYLANLKKYEPSRQREDIVNIYVSDYYSVQPIDGYKAYYVTGSNVYSPMGDEFIPFAQEVDAREFLKDHAGEKILRFHDITPKVLEEFE